MIKSIFQFILLITVILVTCLTPTKASDIVQRVFSERDGLVNGTINDISFDSYGFTWVATEEGLYRVSNSKVRRIDKKGFNTRLSDEYIDFVEPLSKRHLLISNYTDTYLYDILQDSFIRFGSEELFPDYESISLNTIAKGEGGDYLFLTKNGELLTFSYQNMTLNLVNSLPANQDYPWSILTLLDNKRFLVASPTKLQLMDQLGEFQLALDWQEDMGTIKGVIQDSSKRLWLSSSDGLYEIIPDDFSLRKVPQIPLYITKTAEDRKGNLWLASREGLIKWYPDHQEVKVYKGAVKQAADIDYIFDIAIDNNDIIWVGGSGDALAVVAELPDFLTETYTQAPPYLTSNEMIWSIWAKKNGVWLGTDRGLVVINKESQTSATVLPDELALNDSIYKVDELDASHVLLSTTNGLFVVHKETFESQRFAQWTQGEDSLENRLIFSSYLDPQIKGRWWFATGSGLFYWEPELLNPQELLIFEEGAGQYKPNLRAVYRSEDDKLWIVGEELFGYIDDIGVFHSTLSIFDGSNRSPTISYIEEVSPGILWLGSSLGLISYTYDKGLSESLTQKWQVDCSSVFFLHESPPYRILGCLNSIIRVNMNTDELLVIEHEDGLISQEINDGASFYDPSAGLYIGSPDGAMLLNVSKMRNRIKNDGIMLESVSVFYDNST